MRALVIMAGYATLLPPLLLKPVRGRLVRYALPHIPQVSDEVLVLMLLDHWLRYVRLLREYRIAREHGEAKFEEVSHLKWRQRLQRLERANARYEERQLRLRGRWLRMVTHCCYSELVKRYSVEALERKIEEARGSAAVQSEG